MICQGLDPRKEIFLIYEKLFTYLERLNQVKYTVWELCMQNRIYFGLLFAKGYWSRS